MGVLILKKKRNQHDQVKIQRLPKQDFFACFHKPTKTVIIWIYLLSDRFNKKEDWIDGKVF